MSTRLGTVAIAIAALAVGAFAQGPRRDGRWEVKTELDMPGMPAGMPPMTSTQCITPDEAKDPLKAMPQGRGGRGMQGDCKATDYKVDGGHVTWAFKCEGQQQVSGTGDFTYEGEGYTGVVKMDMGGRAMMMKYTGKRLGDCTK